MKKTIIALSSLLAFSIGHANSSQMSFPDSGTNWFSVFNELLENQKEFTALGKSMKRHRILETVYIFQAGSGYVSDFHSSEPHDTNSHTFSLAKKVVTTAFDRVAPLYDPEKRAVVVVFTQVNGKLKASSYLDRVARGTIGRRNVTEDK